MRHIDMPRKVLLFGFLFGCVTGRYLEREARQYDVNAVRADYGYSYSEDSTYEPEQDLLDSCEDFPPASCIKHFSPLPHTLQRSPFALRSESEFIKVCDAYKKALQCFGEFISRCKPDRPEARTFIDQMSALLNQCDSPQVRQDVLVILECGRRMGSVHERCIRETRFIPQLKTLSSERLLQGETNSLRDLCCGMRYHKACFMEQVPERCGQDAREANQRLDVTIFSAFQCDIYSESECPAIRE